MILIYWPTDDARSPDELAAGMPKWFEYTSALQESGAMVAGDALEP